MKAFLLLLLLAMPVAQAAGQQEELPYTRVGNCDDKLVKSEPMFIKALKAIKEKTGKKPQLTSCYRSQARQNAIRQSLGCGPANCRGRAAKRSQHTEGVAADIVVPGVRGRAMCELLNSVRSKVLGHGGVGAYGGGSGHLDMRHKICAWNVCSYLGCSNRVVRPAVEKYLGTQLNQG
jgi:hypothetical protein